MRQYKRTSPYTCRDCGRPHTCVEDLIEHLVQVERIPLEDVHHYHPNIDRPAIARYCAIQRRKQTERLQFA